jgi:hypothetical protein
VTVDHLKYDWEEHLFFSPFHGYRYLVYQNGHFSLVTPLPGYPAETSGSRRTATYEGTLYRHFQQGQAIVHEVIGEFPWLVKRGESVLAVDYVAPPFMLSEERSKEESVWSRGVYMTPSEVAAAVGPTKRPLQRRSGVAPNQPNPHANAWLARATLFALIAWVLLTGVYVARAKNERVADLVVPPKGAPRPAVATDPNAPPETEPAAGVVFPIKLDTSRDPANLEITATAPVDNNWAFVSCALVDTKNEHAYPFGVEVSYYHGYEDGESWSEGSSQTSVILGAIPNGEYVLQVEREDTYPGSVTLTVKRDVVLERYPIVALLIIVLVPGILLVRSKAFETARWSESDHPQGG